MITIRPTTAADAQKDRALFDATVEERWKYASDMFTTRILFAELCCSVTNRCGRAFQLVGEIEISIGGQMSKYESESFHVTQVLAGPPERVFEAWVNPALLQQWLAPKVQVDAREGGHFRLEVPKPEGVHTVTGRFQEFKPNERLVMTWVYDGPMGTKGDMEALLRIELWKHGSNTELTLQHDKLTNPTYRETIAKGAWTAALGRLETVLAGSTRKTA